MTSIDYFITQLKSTKDSILQTLELASKFNNVEPMFDQIGKKLLPDEELFGRFMGTWSRHRLLFHLLYYEENIAISHLKIWTEHLHELDDISNFNEMFKPFDAEEKYWHNKLPREELTSRFESVRREQIKMLQTIDNSYLGTEKNTVWGMRTLEWVLSKTIAHSFEHGSKMYRHALFWENGLLPWMKETSDRNREVGKFVDEDTYQELLILINQAQ